MDATYRDLSLIEKNYYMLLCAVNGYTEANREDVEEHVDARGFSTYTVHVCTWRCDRVMQRVLREAQGYAA